MLKISTQLPYKITCKNILDIDDSIRFVGVINENGRLITGAVKDNIQFHVKEEDREMLFMEAALRTKMLCEFDSSLGPNNFSMYHRKKAIILEFPTGNETIYVSAEKGFDLSRIPFEIIETMRKQNTPHSIVQ